MSKTIDKVQIGAGIGLVALTPLAALGTAIIVWNGGQHILTDKYINWRNNKNSQKLQKAA